MMTADELYYLTGVDLIGDDELAHYGIKGMKWGHRKAQSAPSDPNKKQRRMAIAKAFGKEYGKFYLKGLGRRAVYGAIAGGIGSAVYGKKYRTGQMRRRDYLERVGSSALLGMAAGNAVTQFRSSHAFNQNYSKAIKGIRDKYGPSKYTEMYLRNYRKNYTVDGYPKSKRRRKRRSK